MTRLVSIVVLLSLIQLAHAQGSIDYWTFDQVSDQVDSIGSNNTSLQVNGDVTLSAGVFNNALSFGSGAYLSIDDSVSGYLPCESSGRGPNVFSVSAWINLTSSDQKSVFFEKPKCFSISVINGLVKVELYRTITALSYLRDNVIVPNGDWHHVVATYRYVADKKSEIALYVDGDLIQSSDTAVGPPNNNTNDIRVGPFSGAIDDLRVFDKKLSHDDVLRLFYGDAGELKQADRASVTLAWDSVDNVAVGGYRVHYGIESKNYNQILNVGNITQATINNLIRGVRYYFAVTAYPGLAYEDQYNESDYSNEINTLFKQYLSAPGSVKVINVFIDTSE